MNLSQDLSCQLVLLGLPFAAIATLFTPAAKAEYPCGFAGPGEIVVGSTPSGGGVASVLLCDADPNCQGYQGSSNFSYYDPESAA